jgi:abortive infection bacteriophage resistance protein
MPRVPYDKPALDYAAQLKQLKDRGLNVENEDKALHLLEKISYFRLTSYWYPMLKDPKSEKLFKPDSSFNNAFKLYCFDRELRKLVSGELEKIEIAIRAKMIYVLSHSHGPFWFSDKTLFQNRKKHEESVTKLKVEKERSDEVYIKSFSRKYSDPLPPSWMMLEISSFGNLSSFFYNLKPGLEKRSIANHFGLEEHVLESWLHCFVYVRNLCAHHARLWNRILSITPQVPLSPMNKWITITSIPNPEADGHNIKINNRTYFLLSMIIYLLNIINPSHTFKNKLSELFAKYSNVDLRAIGYPEGWEKESMWSN